MAQLIASLYLLRCLNSDVHTIADAVSTIVASGLRPKSVYLSYSSKYDPVVDKLMNESFDRGDCLAIGNEDYDGLWYATNPEVLVFLAEDLSDFKRLSHGLGPKGRDGRARVLISVPEDFVYIREILEELSSRLVLNVVVLQAIKEGAILYQAVHACRAVVDIREVGRYTEGVLRTDVPLFEKLSQPRHCPLRVATEHWPPYVIKANGKVVDGVEMKIVEAFAAKNNFRLEYVNMSRDELGFWHAIIVEVEANRSDVAMGALSDWSAHGEVGVSKPYLSFGLQFLVPEAIPVPRWKRVADSLTPGVWTAIVAALFFVVLLLRTGGFSGCSHCCFLAVGLSLGQTFEPPRNPVLKIVFVIWTLYSVITSVIYTTALTSCLTRPPMRPAVQSLFGLVRSRLRLYSLRRLDELISLSDDPDMKRFFTEQVVVSPVELKDLLVKLAMYNNFTVLANIQHINYMLGGRMPRFRVLPQVLVRGHVGMVTRRGDDLLESLNVFCSRVLEHGLVEAWKWRVVIWPRRTAHVRHMAHISRQQARPITFTDLTLPFYVLAIGFAISLAVFLGEIVSTFRIEFGRPTKNLEPAR
ncbi:hypothetical protein AAG570_010264 [Ranatra chinensis]|uniref:Solute-binding protein family 3/N-terminal domain-containing protein n=1 Tax=Ranatra chinensis TaxID=642074 RepID=A0ABD0Z864_9HEMI